MSYLKGNKTKVIATTLATLLTSTPFLSVMAQETTENTPKEEVVYIQLNTDGSIDAVHVVNIFDLLNDGTITDYGAYQSVRNMTTTDPISQTDDTITIEADQGKLYYEGTPIQQQMPWVIDIHYFMDGKEYLADEIAGKSGDFKMTISIRKNEEVSGDFFESYALQASVTLDTSRCHEIESAEATIVNVGRDKQLTYMILPGEETDITITATVEDFEMDALAINGIPLQLSIEVDDQELIDRVTELLEAIRQLDDGASEINDGVSEIETSVKEELQAGVQTLDDGAQKLYEGASELKEGGSTLKNGASDLQTGATVLEEGINDLNNGISQIQTSLQTLNQKSDSLTQGSAQIKSALLQIQQALNGVSVTAADLSSLATASSEIKSGIDTLVNQISSLQQGVSYEAYKQVMEQNGLNIDELTQQNNEAKEALQSTITSLKQQIQVLAEAGIDTSQIQEQLGQLESITSLLWANNLNIEGMESYLKTVNANISALLEGTMDLQANYLMFDAKINELVNVLSGLAYQMTELSTAINTLVIEYEKLDSGINAYTEGVAQIVAGYSQLSNGATQLVEGSQTLKSGTNTLYSGTDELLAGIVEFYNGTGSLTDGTGALDDGVVKLIGGLLELRQGTNTLKDGTQTMCEETDGMETEISDKIDELLDSITGGNREVSSFVSDKNTTVNSVQFVITGKAIEVNQSLEDEVEATEPPTFWNKLLNLFKFE